MFMENRTPPTRVFTNLNVCMQIITKITKRKKNTLLFPLFFCLSITSSSLKYIFTSAVTATLMRVISTGNWGDISLQTQQCCSTVMNIVMEYQLGRLLHFQTQCIIVCITWLCKFAKAYKSSDLQVWQNFPGFFNLYLISISVEEIWPPFHQMYNLPATFFNTTEFPLSKPHLQTVYECTRALQDSQIVSDIFM